MTSSDLHPDLHAFWLHCGLPQADWPRAASGLAAYRDLIARHNAAAGLMGAHGVRDFEIKHAADSLAPLLAYRRLLSGPVRLADVGCGAGLPGIVLAIALPELRLTAIESNHKKAAFVTLAARELGLAGRVEVLASRSREAQVDPAWQHRFEVVTARAVATAERLIRECRQLVAPGGSAIFYKTPAAVSAELALARREADKHGLVVEVSEVIDLPAGEGRRQFMRVTSASAASSRAP